MGSHFDTLEIAATSLLYRAYIRREASTLPYWIHLHSLYSHNLIWNRSIDNIDRAQFDSSLDGFKKPGSIHLYTRGRSSHMSRCLLLNTYLISSILNFASRYFIKSFSSFFSIQHLRNVQSFVINWKSRVRYLANNCAILASPFHPLRG